MNGSHSRYLGFDGFTSTFQDMLFKGYKMSMYNQMLYVNAVSSLVSLCGAGPHLGQLVRMLLESWAIALWKLEIERCTYAGDAATRLTFSMCHAGLLSTGQLASALNFMARHPEALLSIFILSLSATLGGHSWFRSL